MYYYYPASMIFIRCEKGISHNEALNILPGWSEKGPMYTSIA